MVQREPDARLDALLLPLARAADVDGERRARRGQQLGRECGAEPVGARGERRALVEGAKTPFQAPEDIVEADAAQTYGRFALAAGGRDDHDGAIAVEQRAGPRGVLAVQADVEAAREMTRGELRGIARVEDLGTVGLQLQHAAQRQLVEAARLVEREA